MEELSWHGGLVCSLGELCVELARFKQRILDQQLTLVSSRAASRAKRFSVFHSCEKLSSSKEELDSSEDIDSGDEGGVRKTGTSLRAAEILL